MVLSSVSKPRNGNQTTTKTAKNKQKTAKQHNISLSPSSLSLDMCRSKLQLYDAFEELLIHDALHGLFSTMEIRLQQEAIWSSFTLQHIQNLGK